MYLAVTLCHSLSGHKSTVFRKKNGQNVVPTTGVKSALNKSRLRHYSHSSSGLMVLTVAILKKNDCAKSVIEIGGRDKKDWKRIESIEAVKISRSRRNGETAANIKPFLN